MGYPTKIATCCYCGTRAALVLKGETQHELCCARCGAPLHELKKRPKKPDNDREDVKRSRARPPEKVYKPRKSQKKKRKGLFVRALEEAFDLVEDIFD